MRDEVTGFLADTDMAFILRDEITISNYYESEQFCIAPALTVHIFEVRLLLTPTKGEGTTLD